MNEYSSFKGVTGHDRAPVIGGVRINFATRTALLDDLANRLATRQGFALATLNLDHLVKLGNDPAFRLAYARQTHVVTDGNPVKWLAGLAGHPVELIPGSELVDPLIALAAQLKVPVAFLGSTKQSLKQAKTHLQTAYPELKIAALIAPPQGLDPEGPETGAALEQIKASGAGLCFLALGAPKQEILAARALDAVPNCGFASVGAGIDFIAGTQHRAPRWVRRLALEWAWRLIGNPKRLARRYWRCALVLPGLGLSALRYRLGV